jgi:hypothetical protein
MITPNDNINVNTLNVIIFEGQNVIIFKCRGYYQFSGVNVIIFEGLDVIIFKCRGCYLPPLVALKQINKAAKI